MRKVSRVHIGEGETARQVIETEGTLNFIFHLDDDHAIRVWFDNEEEGIRVVCQDARLTIKPVTSNVVCIVIEDQEKKDGD